MTELNRFDYFSDIEDHFVRLRGKALYISPLDWELIQQWKDDGVPLHIVVAAIEEVFQKQRAKGEGQRGISTLRYCRAAVAEKFQQWKAGRVGAHESEPRAVATGSSDQDPFSKEVVLAYLEYVRELVAGLVLRPSILASEQTITEPLKRAGLLLSDAHEEFATTPNARVLEEKLTAVERDLDTAIAAVATTGQLMDAELAAIEMFAPYQGKMPAKVYEQQIDAALKKRLREIFGVPRLSLFHMVRAATDERGLHG